MKYLFLSLAPSILGFASFWLSYSQMGGWGWFLFGSVFLGAALYNSDMLSEKCNCKNCKCNSEDSEGCGENCTCK